MKFRKNPASYRTAEFKLRTGTLIAVLEPAVTEFGMEFERLIAIGNIACVMGDSFIWVHPEYRLTSK